MSIFLVLVHFLSGGSCPASSKHLPYLAILDTWKSGVWVLFLYLHTEFIFIINLYLSLVDVLSYLQGG